MCGSRSWRGDGGADASAHRFESLAHLVQAWRLVLCEMLKFFRVGGLGVLELVVDHAQLRPALGERALARLAELAALAGGLPLSEPERFALRPALRLVGVVVREQVVEVFQVAFERLFDDRNLLEASLHVGGRGQRADRRARRDRVAAAVDRHADRHEHVGTAERDEPQHQPGEESSIAAKFGGRCRSRLFRGHSSGGASSACERSAVASRKPRCAGALRRNLRVQPGAVNSCGATGLCRKARRGQKQPWARQTPDLAEAAAVGRRARALRGRAAEDDAAGEPAHRRPDAGRLAGEQAEAADVAGAAGGAVEAADAGAAGAGGAGLDAHGRAHLEAAGLDARDAGGLPTGDLGRADRFPVVPPAADPAAARAAAVPPRPPPPSGARRRCRWCRRVRSSRGTAAPPRPVTPAVPVVPPRPAHTGGAGGAAASGRAGGAGGAAASAPRHPFRRHRRRRPTPPPVAPPPPASPPPAAPPPLPAAPGPTDPAAPGVAAVVVDRLIQLGTAAAQPRAPATRRTRDRGDVGRPDMPASSIIDQKARGP